MAWLSLLEAKRNLNIGAIGEESEAHPDDAMIQGFIDVAKTQIENETGLCLKAQSDFSWDTYRFPQGDTPFRLPEFTVTSVARIQYMNNPGVLQTLVVDDDFDFMARDRLSGRNYPHLVVKVGSSWPSDARCVAGRAEIQVRGTKGLADADIPDPIKQVGMLLINGWYDLRSPEAYMPDNVRALLYSYLPFDKG